MFNQRKEWIRKCHILSSPPPKKNLTNQIYMKNEHNACVIHSMNITQKLNTSSNFMPNFTVHSKLTTLHWKYVNCPLIQTTYFQILIPKLESYLNGWCEHFELYIKPSVQSGYPKKGTMKHGLGPTMFPMKTNIVTWSYFDFKPWCKLS